MKDSILTLKIKELKQRLTHNFLFGRYDISFHWRLRHTFFFTSKRHPLICEWDTPSHLWLRYAFSFAAKRHFLIWRQRDIFSFDSYETHSHLRLRDSFSYGSWDTSSQTTKRHFSSCDWATLLILSHLVVETQLLMQLRYNFSFRD